MKKELLIVTTISFLMIQLSCKRETPKLEFCVNDSTSSYAKTLLDSVSAASARVLFEQNQIKCNNLQFYDISQSSDGNFHVFCNQIINGVRVFNKSITYHFNDSGRYFCTTGDSIGCLKIDTTPTTTDLNRLIPVFLNAVSTDSNHSTDINSICKGCFIAIFGIFIDPYTNQYIKVWKISAENRKYPFMYINDANYRCVNYDNGYRLTK